MKKTVLLFGLLIIVLLSLFQLSKYTIQTGDLSIEIIIAMISIVFFFVGVFINKKMNPTKHSNVHEVDSKKIEELHISPREYDVLCEIVKGASNREIAETLFVSESTIKTHVSSILVKLNAKRRTQAIQIAKELNIIPNF